MLFILVFLYLGGAALFDLRTGKIPNRYLLLWAAVFLWYMLWSGTESIFADAGSPADVSGSEAVSAVPVALKATGQCFWGILVTVSVLFPLFFFRMMGAGDVKQMALLVGILGVTKGFEIIFCGLAAAAVWSFFCMVRKRIFFQRIGYFLNYVELMKFCIRDFPRGEVPVPYYDAARDGREPAFCLAPFMLLGYIWYLFAYGLSGGMGRML